MNLKDAKEMGLRNLTNSEIIYYNDFRQREHLSYNIKEHSANENFFIYQNQSNIYWMESR